MDLDVLNTSQIDFEAFEVFPWNSNLETGVQIIDEQHMALVALLNKLARTLIYEEPAEVQAVFTELADYANFHFGAEEQIWQCYFQNDEWFSGHCARHSRFLPAILKIKEGGTELPLADIVENIVKFLIRWLAFHIIDNDKRMALAIAAVETGMPLLEAKSKAESQMSGSMRMLIDTILKMYEGLSSNAIALMKERRARIKAEDELKKANKKLKNLSITDQLTGLHNRRHFLTIFKQELARARRSQTELSYMLIDIDAFKAFNDNYGHVQGDSALEIVGRCLRQVCRRGSDFAFRLGGEEFGILATNLTADKAEVFAEIVRAKIEGLRIAHEYSPIGKWLTVSIGLVIKIPAGDDTLERFSKFADTQLYLAKKEGKNRVKARNADVSRQSSPGTAHDTKLPGTPDN